MSVTRGEKRHTIAVVESSEQTCPDPWHEDDDAPCETYTIEMEKYSMEGYRCLTCGMQTVTVDTYIPVGKICPKCKTTFEGIPDEADELCDACVMANLVAYLKGVLAERGDAG